MSPSLFKHPEGRLLWECRTCEFPRLAAATISQEKDSGKINMTNTLASMFGTVATGITGTVDWALGIGLAITVGLLAFALIKKFAPQRKKIV